MSSSHPSTVSTKRQHPPPYTQLFHNMTAQFGIIGAAVYGEVWRYSNLKDEGCWASYPTIAANLGIDEKTVSRWVKKLKLKGLIEIKPRDGKTNYVTLTPDSESTTPDTESEEKTTENLVTDSVTYVTESRTEIPRSPPSISKTSQDKRHPAKGRPYWGEVEPLVKHFSAVTKLPLPKLGTQAKFRSANRLWREPLMEILSLSGGNIAAANLLITRAVHEMANLTVASPQSILKVCLDLFAKAKRGGASGISTDAFLEELRKP